ncbi:MAG TPA: DUF4199 domain-containing protein [Ferruginibacter sp.]|nr:DUF4199 domain-containing protein [Ferruginibacter sp.]
MTNISARNKGLVTGAVMIIISVCIYLVKKNFDNGMQYIVYSTYVAGILWTLFTFKKQTDNTATFKQYFSEGFKCFIVVTLLMVIFTLVFILMHPELKEQMAAFMRTDYEKQKDMTPADVENKIEMAKKMFLPGYLMGAVFSYLVIGTLITVVGAGFLGSKKNS